MELSEVTNEIWENICVLEMNYRHNSPKYIQASINSGFRKAPPTITKNTHFIVYHNTYYKEVLIFVNILDMSAAPFWMVRHLEKLGFRVPILFNP